MSEGEDSYSQLPPWLSARKEMEDPSNAWLQNAQREGPKAERKNSAPDHRRQDSQPEVTPQNHHSPENGTWPVVAGTKHNSDGNSFGQSDGVETSHPQLPQEAELRQDAPPTVPSSRFPPSPVPPPEAQQNQRGFVGPEVSVPPHQRDRAPREVASPNGLKPSESQTNKDTLGVVPQRTAQDGMVNGGIASAWEDQSVWPAQVTPAPAQMPSSTGMRPPSGKRELGLLRRLFGRDAHRFEQRKQQLVPQLSYPLNSPYKVAMLSLKGGVGKTTVTVGLGATFASEARYRALAIDANPHLGTLGRRVQRQTSSTVRDLLQGGEYSSAADVRIHTNLTASGLEILASESNPSVSEGFGNEDYLAVLDIVQPYYNLILTDCGTGLMHSAMRGVLDSADSLVLVSTPAIDGAHSAWSTLDWLSEHGYRHLVERSVVAICSPRPGASSVDHHELVTYFSQRCRSVQFIPYDEHLAQGHVVEIGSMAQDTQLAFLELAASVAADFSRNGHY